MNNLSQEELILQDELIVAADKEDYENIKSLLKQGADINRRNFQGFLPFMIACEQGKINMVKFLFENGAKINKVNNRRVPLMLACQKENIKLIKFLLDNGADINLVEQYGFMALVYACERENLTMIKLLIERGININQENTYGDTALLYACKRKDVELIKFLLDNNADINYSNQFNQTVFDTSIFRRGENKELTKLLILREMKFKDFVLKISSDSIKIYEILMNEIKEKAIVQEILDMKYELELLRYY